MCISRILVFVTLFGLNTSANYYGNENQIYWKTVGLPFIYEQNITLFCNTSAVGSQAATWMRQSDVVLHRGLSFYPDKYTEKLEIDGSSLIILHATESDFNTSYTCLSDEFSYEATLNLNISDVIYLPHSAVFTWTIAEKTIYMWLVLDRFYPVPDCGIMFLGDKLIKNQQETVYLQNRFYYGTINITSQSATVLCGGNLTVVCLFGGLYSEAIETITLQNCDHGSEFPEHCFGLGRIIIVCILCIILCYLWFILVKYHCKFQEEKKNTAGGCCHHHQYILLSVFSSAVKERENKQKKVHLTVKVYKSINEKDIGTKRCTKTQSY